MNPWPERGSAVAYEAITQSCHCEAYYRFVRSATDSKLRYIVTAETGTSVRSIRVLNNARMLSWQTFETTFRSFIFARKNREAREEDSTRVHHSMYTTLRMDGLRTRTKQKCTLFRPVSYDSSLVLIIRDAEYGTGDGVLLAVRSEQRSTNRRVYFSL